MRVIMLLALMLNVALAHEGEDWIRQKNLLDPVSQAYCCGPNDCRVLPDEDVTEINGGWRVFLDESHDAVFVPYARGLPVSPDTHYHVCVTRDVGTEAPKLRCFITPPNPS